MIIDSHCHLDYPNLYDRLDEIISSAKLNKVEKMLTICTTIESFEKIKNIIAKHNSIYGTFGIHPHETEKHLNVNEKYIIEKVQNNKKIIGIGETGLDFYYNHSDKKVQKKSFIEHLLAASFLNIPTIVHSRDAENETYEIIKDFKKNNNLKVLIHCFTGSTDFMKKLINLNCFISISGIITFKNVTDLANTVSLIPMENLLVETDSPYLAPMPHRGKTNEPSYIINTIEKIAQIKKVSADIIIKHTTLNFKNLFNTN